MRSQPRLLVLLLAVGLLACPTDDGSGDDELGSASTSSGSSSEASEAESSSSTSADESSTSDSSTSDSSTSDSSTSDSSTSDSSTSADESSTSTDESSTSTDESSGGFDCVPVDPPVPPADCAAANILLTPEFADDYECFDLGNLPDVPTNWGGLTVKIDDPYTLLIGGAANTAAGKLYAVEITRDAGCHVTGWAGTPIVEFAEAAYNDGGVTYGPADVLFLARWPNNELGQQALGSLVTDKVVALGPLGIVSSPGGLNFVPIGFGGEGQLKLVSWPGGQWYAITLSPDGMGTFSIDAATHVTTIQGGPEGFVHISDQNPGFPVDGLLVSEYSAGSLAAYDVDANGDPIVLTRRPFVTGLTGAEGAFLDPLSGDFLFTTFGGGNRLVAIRGFTPNPQ
jgi:hypothetical protein